MPILSRIQGWGCWGCWESISHRHALERTWLLTIVVAVMPLDVLLSFKLTTEIMKIVNKTPTILCKRLNYDLSINILQNMKTLQRFFTCIRLALYFD